MTSPRVASSSPTYPAGSTPDVRSLHPLIYLRLVAAQWLSEPTPVQASSVVRMVADSGSFIDH